MVINLYGNIGMLSVMHDITRHKELVIKKPKENEKKPLDPDQFPIQKLSGELIEEYESVWNIEKDTLRK